MVITVKKDLDIARMYNEIIESFSELDECEENGIAEADLTPELMKIIFAALSEEAANRE